VAANTSTLDTFVASNSGSGFPMFVGGSNGGVYVDANGDFTATGSINGAIKNFRIDHPLDPANKYLNHTSIESSEMLNLYTGNAVLDANGAAKVTLPAWFTEVNEDFRYQLTPVGAFAPLYIAEQFTTDHFVIAGGQPGMKVSWQITGVRHDAYAKAHPLAVEEAKGTQRGLYLHPELYGATKDKSIVATHLAGLKSTRTHASTSR
jgi:trimeric autotransporter adhesin